MHGLQWIDQHAGDVAPRAQYTQRCLVHVAQCVAGALSHRIADARLHLPPPAVIGTAKAHQIPAARVVAHKTHRLAPPCAPAFYAFLVEVVAEEIYSVRAREVKEGVAVGVGYRDSGGGLQKHAHLQMLADEAAELKRHAIARGELRVREAAFDLRG